jgi:EAL domain-containing protein (putative c-di-GMP-specific phosphodiesterase class I)
VIVDLHMPALDGHAVMEALRRDGGDSFLPVLVLTADITTDARDRALGAGANDFLTKPFDRTEVTLRVSNLLEMRALYNRLADTNRQLRRDLDAELEHERHAAAERASVAARIRDVLDHERFEMVFQPVVDITNRTIAGVESLARFAAEPAQPPNMWFDDAARVGMALDLELACVRRALSRLDELPPGAFMAVNASPEIVLTDELARCLADTDAERVVVELTEHVRVHDYDALRGAVDRLRRCGARIAVDDAGAGYAGLSHILELRPDVLKLDITLIHGIDDDPVRRSLAASLLWFSKEIGAIVVAEGVETAEELAVLGDLGVTFGQGYHLARPGPLPVPPLLVSPADLPRGTA